MLMFNFHTAFALALIALAFGAALLIWSKVHKDVGTSLAKVIGYVVIVAATLNILCNGYYAMKYKSEGYFDKPCPAMMMHEFRMMKNMQPMMNKDMQKPTNMEPMMDNEATKSNEQHAY